MSSLIDYTALTEKIAAQDAEIAKLQSVAQQAQSLLTQGTSLAQQVAALDSKVSALGTQVQSLSSTISAASKMLDSLQAVLDGGSSTSSGSGTTTSGSTSSGSTSSGTSSGSTSTSTSGSSSSGSTSGTSSGSGSTSGSMSTSGSTSSGSTSSSGSTTSGSGSTTNAVAAAVAGLQNRGTELVSFSPMAKPEKLVPSTDPDFGTKIIRITDGVTDFHNLAVAPAYPTAMAWNCDETRFILYAPGSTAQANGQQGWAMYDGKTYAFIKFLDINPGDVEQFYWDRNDPATLRYIDNHSMGSQNLADLTAINVETGVKTIVHSFLPNGLPPGCPKDTNMVRCGYPFALGINENGDRIWGLGAAGPSVPNVSGELGVWVFGFNETTKAFTIYDTSVVPQPQARGSTPFASISGKFFVWNAAKGLNSYPNTQSAVLDAVTGKLVRMIDFDTNEHCDTALDAAGEDLLVGSQFSRNTGGNGNCVIANLNTGVVTVLVGEGSSPSYGYPATGSLTGSTGWKVQSLAATGMIGDIYGTGSNGKANPSGNGNSGPTANPCTLLDQEVMLTNLSTGESYRIAHHRSTGNYSNAPQSNYWAQPNVTLSPSGTRILVQSDWGAGNPSAPTLNPNAAVDTYVIELPSYKG